MRGRGRGLGAGGPAAPQGHHSLLAVTEQLKVPNEHFNARLGDGGLGAGTGISIYPVFVWCLLSDKSIVVVWY